MGLVRTLLVALTAAAALPATATAATVVGDPLTADPTGSAGCPTASCVVSGAASAGAVWTVPEDGVVTGVDLRGAIRGPTSEAFMVVLRPQPGGWFQVAGRENITGPRPAVFPCYCPRLPVKAGDRLGLDLSGGWTIGTRPDPAARYDRFEPAPAGGTTGSPAVSPTGEVLTYNAVIEPDRDGDGYGDETQDQCATDPSVVGATGCPELAVTGAGSPAEVRVGETFTNTFTVRNTSTTTPARDVTFGSVRFGNSEYVASSCPAQLDRQSFYCALGTIEPQQSVTVNVTLRATAAGISENRGDAFRPFPDPNPGNDQATVRTTMNALRTCGLRIVGDRRGNSLTGTDQSETILGGAGNDRLSGGDGKDCVSGSAGNDRLSGGDGNDLLSGGSGSDRLTGDDGRDRLDGDSGNDTIRAADGNRDAVTCGTGRDKVTADRGDRIARDCERVSRRR